MQTFKSRKSRQTICWKPCGKASASVASLLQLTMGALHIARPPWSPSSPNQGGAPLHARLRHFDPARKRAGLPEDVAVLVEKLEPGRTGFSIVNLNPKETRALVIQGGAYGEHQIQAIHDRTKSRAIDHHHFPLWLAPGCGTYLELTMKRYANAPTLKFPWDQASR